MIAALGNSGDGLSDYFFIIPITILEGPASKHGAVSQFKAILAVTGQTNSQKCTLILLLLLPPCRLHITSSLDSIVFLGSNSITIKDLLEPLQKLKVVLVFALYKLLHFDVLHDAQLGETLLQDLEIGHKLVVELGAPVDLAQGDLAGIEDVHELAVDCTGSQLLNLGQVSLEEVVEPPQQLSPRHLDGVVGVYSHLVYHLCPLCQFVYQPPPVNPLITYTTHLHHQGINTQQQISLWPLPTLLSPPVIRKAIVSQTIRSFLAGIDLLGVELEFLSLQDVSVSSSGLSGSGADAGEEPLLGELFSDLRVNDSSLLALVNAGLGALGLLVLDLDVLGLLDVEVDAVVVDVPLGEGSGVDLDDTVLDEGIGADQLVVGGIVDDVEDTGLAGGGLRGPVEVTFLKTEGAELVVTSSDSHTSDPGCVGDELGIGDGSCLFEGSLLLVDGHPATGQSALVPGVSVDSHWNMVKLISNKIIINHLSRKQQEAPEDQN